MVPSAFASLVDSFLTREYEDSPTLASSLGLTEYDERLDDTSAAAYEERRETDLDWLRRFRAVVDDGLTPADRIDRDLLVSVLRGRELYQPLDMWKRQPNYYLNPGLNGVFSLFLHRLRPERELAAAAAKRLEGVPTNIRDGLANLDFSRTPRVYVERAIGQAKAAARYARELVPAEVNDASPKQHLTKAGAMAGKAFDEFGSFLESNKERAQGDYAIGEELYSALLREKELLPFGAAELRERGHEQHALLSTEANRIATEIDGSGDWAKTCDRLNKIHAPTPDAMRDEYAEWTERARSFLRDTGLVTLPPGEKCTVEPSPPFQRPVLAVASYQRPPAFRDTLHGHFFVPYPPDGTSSEEVQKRLEGNCSAGIPTTAVQAKANPSHTRRIFGTAYFSEGWALYAERVMREQGFFTDPKHLLYQYEATIFRAARIVVDTSLHMGEMTFDEAVRFMVEKGNLTEPNARAEVGRYCSWPTQASSYLTGMLEIVDIRTRWLAKRGQSDRAALRVFHDAITTAGMLPTTLAEQAIST